MAGEPLLRALVATSTFPLHEGDGTPRFVEDLCRALAPHCALRVLAPDAPGAASRETRHGLEIERFRYFAPRSAQRLAYGAGMPDNLRASWGARLQAAPYLWAQARATRQACREHGARVVNSHWLLPTGLANAVARGGGRGRFAHVVTLHGGDAHLLRRLPFGGALARFVVARSDALLAVSSNVKANLDAALGRDSGAKVQPMGVHTERFREGPVAESGFRDGYVLFVGRMIRIKGADVLLRAFAHLHPEHTGLGLVLIGDGPELPALRQQARAAGIEHAVDFRGPQPHDVVAATLRGCRVAVVPSVVDADGREEGMPAVVAEALAAGARVVASRSGGIPDVLRSGENGWLANPGDAEDLAHGLAAALAEPRPSPIDAAARRSADALDWSHVARVYGDVFREAAGG